LFEHGAVGAHSAQRKHRAGQPKADLLPKCKAKWFKCKIRRRRYTITSL